MTEGDILLTPLQQSDGRIKNRPVVVLRVMPPFDDLLVCGVSTQLRHAVPDFDEIISVDEDDFYETGLKKTSVIRLGYLAVLPTGNFAGTLGHITTERHDRLLTQLAEFIEGGKTQGAAANP